MRDSYIAFQDSGEKLKFFLSFRFPARTSAKIEFLCNIVAVINRNKISSLWLLSYLANLDCNLCTEESESILINVYSILV